MRWSVFGVLVMLAACSVSPAPRLYLLAAPAEGVVADREVRGPSLQIQPVLIPDYLDTTDLLLRTGTHEIRASLTGRWGERLSAGLAHALLGDLAARLPGARVFLAPPTQAGAVQVAVNVDALDVWEDGHCVLVAHWSVGGRMGQGLFTSAAAGAADDAGRVAGLASVVGQLADRIAGAAGA